MRHLLTFAMIGALALPAAADEHATAADVFLGAESTDLDSFVWTKRPIIVFADSENDPSFVQQMDFLMDQIDELRERDVVVMTDTDPSTVGPLRKALRPRGFMLVLIGKDGGVKLRKPFPWDVRELSRTIDKMPMRQNEIRQRQES